LLWQREQSAIYRPEDVGGRWGYGDPVAGKEHLQEYYGGEFDPKALRRADAVFSDPSIGGMRTCWSERNRRLVGGMDKATIVRTPSYNYGLALRPLRSGTAPAAMSVTLSRYPRCCFRR
jgi:hypothetical protein